MRPSLALFGMLIVSGVALATAATAAEEPQPKPKPSAETGRFYVPNAGKVGSNTVMPGEEILRQPIVWGLAAKLSTDVRFQTSTGDVVVKAGETLPAVQISGLPGAAGNGMAYCTNVPHLKQKNHSLVGMLSAAIVRSLQDGRKCLLDKNGDGAADVAFLIDDGQPADRTPRPIEPVALNVAEMAEVGPGDYIAIQARRGTRPSFRIIIVQNGKHVNFDAISTSEGTERRFQSVQKNVVYPLTHRVYGAQFEILAHDPKTGAMKIAWPAEAIPVKIAVPSEIEYSYRYY